MGNVDGYHGKRALKQVTVQQLETAIAAALYKITAHKYHVDIKRFDLDLGHDSALRDGAVIEMRVVDSAVAATAAPSRFLLDGPPTVCQNAKEPGLEGQAPGVTQGEVQV